MKTNLIPSVFSANGSVMSPQLNYSNYIENNMFTLKSEIWFSWLGSFDRCTTVSKRVKVFTLLHL